MTHVNPRVLCLKWPKSLILFFTCPLTLINIWNSAHSFPFCPRYLSFVFLTQIYLKEFFVLSKIDWTSKTPWNLFIRHFKIYQRVLRFQSSNFFLIVQNVWKRTCHLYVVELNTLCCLTDFCPAPNPKSMWKERFIPTK